MAWVDLSTLANSEFIDFDVIDKMIDNMIFLRGAIPEIHQRNSAGKVTSSDGTTNIRMRIQTGHTNVPSFKGTHLVKIPLIKANTGNADYPIQVTLKCNADIRAMVSSQNNKEFTVRLIPTSKAAMRGVGIFWTATTRE